MSVGEGEVTMPTAMWFKEPVEKEVKPAGGKAEKPAAAGATFALGSGQKGLPIALATGDLDIKKDDGFFTREMKFARRWLYSKGVMTDDEDRNPVETELESFFHDSRTGGPPKAGPALDLHHTTAFIHSDL